MANEAEYVCYDNEEDDNYGPPLVDSSEEYELDEIEDATPSNVIATTDRATSGVESTSRLNTSTNQTRRKTSKVSRQDSSAYDLPDLSDNDSSSSSPNQNPSTNNPNKRKVGKKTSKFTNVKCRSISCIISAVAVIVTVSGIAVYITSKQEGNDIQRHYIHETII
jgi:hypothetical protein